MSLIYTKTDPNKIYIPCEFLFNNQKSEGSLVYENYQEFMIEVLGDLISDEVRTEIRATESGWKALEMLDKFGFEYTCTPPTNPKR